MFAVEQNYYSMPLRLIRRKVEARKPDIAVIRTGCSKPSAWPSNQSKRSFHDPQKRRRVAVYRRTHGE